MTYLMEPFVFNDAFYNNKLELVDNDADVIIYSCGGGDSLPMFHHNLLTIMKKRQRYLTPPYLCIHIRNTDYTCDYQKYFYKHEKNIRSFKEVRDVSTLHFYKQNGIHVKNFTTFPSKSYESLHTSAIDPHTKMIDLFCDIYIAGLSHTLLSNSDGGFILLLRSIHRFMKYTPKLEMILRKR